MRIVDLATPADAPLRPKFLVDICGLNEPVLNPLAVNFNHAGQLSQLDIGDFHLNLNVVSGFVIRLSESRFRRQIYILRPLDIR